MPDKGFKINSCDCGEILIDFGAVRDSVASNELPDAEALMNLKEDEKYCPNCRKIVKINN